MLSVLTWRNGSRLRDAHATPYVVPNEVANLCFGSGLAECRENACSVYGNRNSVRSGSSAQHFAVLTRFHCVLSTSFLLLLGVTGLTLPGPWNRRSSWRMHGLFFGVLRRTAFCGLLVDAGLLTLRTCTPRSWDHLPMEGPGCVAGNGRCPHVSTFCVPPVHASNVCASYMPLK